MLPCSATDSIKLYWNTLGVSPAIPDTNSITGYNPGVLGVTTSNSIESFLSGKTYEEIQAQWYDDDYWESIPAQAAQLDALIAEFNQRVGLV